MDAAVQDYSNESVDGMNDTAGAGSTICLETAFNFFQENCVQDPLQFALTLVKTVALGIIILLTICGNVLILMAVAVSPNLRSSTHYLIVNLAIADLLLGTTVLPFSAAFEITGRWYFGQTFCTIWAAVDVLYCTASILSLCVISLDRYIGVTRPLAYSTIMLGRRTSILIVLIWALSILISIGPLFGWKGPPSENPYDCTINKELAYVLFSATGSFYLPMFIILFVYWKIYKAAIRQTKFLECGMKTTKQDVTLRVHLGGTNGRANSTPDLAIIRGSNPKHEFGPATVANGANRSQYNLQKPLAPLARPEASSSSSHGAEEYGQDPSLVLRVHRGGGGKHAKPTTDLNLAGLGVRNGKARNGKGGHHHHLHNDCIHGHRHQKHQQGSQPNSLTPSPPSSSPERKLNPGFGKIAKFRRQKKAAKTLAIVVGVFLLCWFPFFFILPLDALCRQCQVPSEVFDLFFWLGYFNSCLNPFIYACTSREFQRAFRRILCRRRTPPRPHMSRHIYRATNMQTRFQERNCNGNSIPLQQIQHHWS